MIHDIHHYILRANHVYITPMRTFNIFNFLLLKLSLIQIQITLKLFTFKTFTYSNVNYTKIIFIPLR